MRDSLAGDLLDLVLPQACDGCGRAAAGLCPACRAALRAGPRLVRPTSASPSVSCVAAAGYEGTTRELLLAFKERGRLGLRRPLGDALAVAVAGLLAASDADAGPGPFPRRPPDVVLVPVPSAAGARRRRGYDHTLLLARHAAQGLRAAGHRSQVRPVLRLVRTTADQAGLDRAARLANLLGAVGTNPAAGARLRDRQRRDGCVVVVVDDIVTTGATLAASVQALADRGLVVAGGAVVAATPAPGAAAGAFAGPGADGSAARPPDRAYPH